MAIKRSILHVKADAVFTFCRTNLGEIEKIDVTSPDLTSYSAELIAEIAQLLRLHDYNAVADLLNPAIDALHAGNFQNSKEAH